MNGDIYLVSCYFFVELFSKGFEYAKCLSSLLEIHMIIIWGCFFNCVLFRSCELLENKQFSEFIYLSIHKSVHMCHRKIFVIIFSAHHISNYMLCLTAFCINLAKVDNITAWMEIMNYKKYQFTFFDVVKMTNFT